MAPVIVESSGTVTVAQDEGAALICIAQGCPAPEYRYLYRNTFQQCTTTSVYDRTAFIFMQRLHFTVRMLHAYSTVLNNVHSRELPWALNACCTLKYVFRRTSLIIFLYSTLILQKIINIRINCTEQNIHHSEENSSCFLCIHVDLERNWFSILYNSQLNQLISKNPRSDLICKKFSPVRF